jgi:hypothetical protein
MQELGITDRSGYWWPNEGQHIVTACVPNIGRGLLAKIGLIPHSILTYCLKVGMDRPSYNYSHLIETLIDKETASFRVDHPLSYSATLPTILAFSHAYVTHW